MIKYMWSSQSKIKCRSIFTMAAVVAILTTLPGSRVIVIRNNYDTFKNRITNTFTLDQREDALITTMKVQCHLTMAAMAVVLNAHRIYTKFVLQHQQTEVKKPVKVPCTCAKIIIKLNRRRMMHHKLFWCLTSRELQHKRNTFIWCKSDLMK